MSGDASDTASTTSFNNLLKHLSNLGVKPNHLTFSGLAVNVVAAFLFAGGQFLWAGIGIMAAGVFDILDGAVARASGRVTRFGAFLDSVMDRYSDVVLYIGAIMFYIRQNDLRTVLVAMMALIGSFMVSYTRARAESIMPRCRVGLMERPERLVMLTVGAFLGNLRVALWLLAISTHYTVAQRIYYSWLKLALEEGKPQGAAYSSPLAPHRSGALRFFDIIFRDFERRSWQYLLLAALILLLQVALSLSIV